MTPAERVDVLLDAWRYDVDSVPFPTWQVADLKESTVESA